MKGASGGMEQVLKRIENLLTVKMGKYTQLEEALRQIGEALA